MLIVIHFFSISMYNISITICGTFKIYHNKEVLIMAYTADNIAKYVVDRCVREGKAISNLQLQKTLYYIQLNFIRLFDKVAFFDDFEAWDYGHVVPSVYEEYRQFGGAPICMMFDGIFTIFSNREEQQLVNDVTDVCVDMDPWDLVDSSHIKDGPWDIAYSKNKNAIIELKDMFEYAKRN